MVTAEPVVAWGDNYYGQCDVPIGLVATQVSAGGMHSLALGHFPPTTTTMTGHIYDAWETFAVSRDVPIYPAQVSCEDTVADVNEDGSFELVFPGVIPTGTILEVKARATDYCNERVAVPVVGTTGTTVTYRLWPVSQYGKVLK